MKVLVTDPIDEAGLNVLREAGHEVVEDMDLDHAGLVEAVADVDALLIRGTVIDEAVFAAAPNLRIVTRAGIGVDNIDIEAATEHGVVVANAPRGNVMAAAEHTIALLTSVVKSIPAAHEALTADGEWDPEGVDRGEIEGLTAGIFGLGRLGQQVARRYQALGMDVIAHDPYVGADRADQLDVDLLPLDEMLAGSDVLSVQARLTDETEGAIGAAELDQFAGDYVIHSSRGGVVDEPALRDAVESGELRGAGVDVFATEPPGLDHPLIGVDDVVTTPHLGGTTYTAQERVGTTCARQILACFDGERVENALNVPSTELSPRLQRYSDLVETASRVALRLFDGRVEELEVTYAGEFTGEDVDLLTGAAFRKFGWQDRVVNVPAHVSDKRGIDVTESLRRETKDYRSLVSVTVSDGTESLSVSATLLGEDDPRLVEIDGYDVEAIPSSRMLVVRNTDEPGVIGFIGSVLGEYGVNIAGMFNARETRGGEALNVYSLDETLPEDALAQLRADDRVVEVQPVALS